MSKSSIYLHDYCTKDKVYCDKYRCTDIELSPANTESVLFMCGRDLTCALVKLENGFCPRLQISYMTIPKLHTSLAIDYFL